MEYARYALFRNSKGMNDNQVAKATGIGNSTISDWKKGKSVPKQDKLMKIAEVLGVDFPTFIDTRSTAEKSIDIIEKHMQNLDINALDRVIKYAEYLKTISHAPTDKEIMDALKNTEGKL